MLRPTIVDDEGVRLRSKKSEKGDLPQPTWLTTGCSTGLGLADTAPERVLSLALDVTEPTS